MIKKISLFKNNQLN